MYSREQQKALLQLARDAIGQKLNGKAITRPADPAFKEKRGLFVTLHKHGELRGCIGYVQGYKDIASSVLEMAQAAAFRDPRFSPLRLSELSELEIEISVLSELIPVKDISEIVIGRDGLILQHPYGSGLLLPQVPVEWHWDLPTFLKQLCYKAGLPDGSHQDPKAVLLRFSAEVFGEDGQNRY